MSYLSSHEEIDSPPPLFFCVDAVTAFGALPLNCSYRFKIKSAELTDNVYDEQACESFQDFCAASALRTNIGKPQEQLLNRCSLSRDCFSGDYSFTAGNGKFFQTKNDCCNTELCNNATLSLPDRNLLAENGLQCPACYSNGTKRCKSEKTINCLENETQCVDFQGALNIALIQLHKFTFQGCGTTDFCAIQKNERRTIRFGNFLLFVKQISCYNDSQISHQLEHEG
ncbi:phospholipase A2 inhibitor and Ly6/PLAUR domain-containing protein-like [Podarcis raffonei]|uniref:phospholipase A2 inhibitor and Ly6/PLAUR domain-containing protein-like n=1 Tax=Podarcis raffonei TaxID=65483 RepID=UPI0023290F2B|nr:phospholipase A2 inhibitor and Ly6/PLAUR domain-containing protein-like [Podarcis raffonei]